MGTPAQVVAPNKTAGMALQTFLNSKGVNPPLIVDGQCGRMTTAAIYTTFRNKNPIHASDADYDAVAHALGDRNSTRLRAVCGVETNGAAWYPDGSLKLLYERSYFWNLTKGRYGITLWSNPDNGGYTIDADKDGINDSWEKLAAASAFDAQAAFSSISVSEFQIMGRWYQQLGFNTPWEMLWAATNSEVAQLQMLQKWITSNSKQSTFLSMGLTAASCVPMAKWWNGGGYAANQYDVKLAQNIKRLQVQYGNI